MNKLLFLILTALLSFSMISCDSSDEPEASYLKLESPGEILTDFDKSVSVLNIKSNSSWMISIPGDIDWIDVDNYAGMNDAEVSLTIAKNPTAADRNAVITISLLDKSKSVEVKVSQVFNGDMDVFDGIKDTNFKEYCKQFDLDGNGILSLQEANEVQAIDVTPDSSTTPQYLVASFEGIEYFPNLISLAFSNNVVSDIDLSKNTKLREIIAINNKLSTIDVSNCPDLEYLYLSQNPLLKKVDVTRNPKLIKLFTEEDELITSIDLSNCPELTDIQMYSNSISSIDFSTNKKLQNIGLDKNQLSSIDVSMLPELERLNIDSNKLAGNLDLSNNPKLLVLNISNNSFTSFNITNCPQVNTLYCTNNQLSEINVSKNTKLTSLHCSGNLFKSVDISGCPDMVQFLCTNQPELTEINISNCNGTSLVSFWAFNNPKMKTIWVWNGFRGIPSYADWLIQEGVDLKTR